MNMDKYRDPDEAYKELILLIKARQKELIEHSDELLALQYKRLHILRKGIVGNNWWGVILTITALLFGLTLILTGHSDYVYFIHLIFDYQLSPFLIVLTNSVITAIPIVLLIKTFISIHKLNKKWRYEHTNLLKDIEVTKQMVTTETAEYQKLKNKFDFE